MEKSIMLKNGMLMPKLGMGTWYLGDEISLRSQEIEALQAGVSMGIRMIDTAEIYGGGNSEQLIGQAIRDFKRDELFLVSKVYPGNATRKKIEKRINHTLKFLKTDYLDLYLMHWRGSADLEEMVFCMENLVKSGKIRCWGVSNFDLQDMKELTAVPGGEHCTVNQVLYHLGSRGIEYDLLPWQKENHIPVMAYCPLAQAGRLQSGLLNSPAVKAVAEKHGIKPIQVLLAFVLNQDFVAAIPRSGKKEHVIQNGSCLDIELDSEDLRLLNEEFPAPSCKTPLEIV